MREFDNSLNNATEVFEKDFNKYLENGEITNGERRLLEKLREKLGISEARAIELERQLMLKKLSAEEIEYLEEYRECLAESGFISSSERRLLNRLRTKLNISEESAKELENI